MRSLPGFVVLLLSLPHLSCRAPSEPDPPTRFDDPWITDDQGRVLILHGANIAGSAKDSADHMPSQDRATMQRMVADWGWNHARFLIFWDGLEPQPGVYDHAYLDLVEERLDWLAQMGVWVVIDMHQDVYARKFCCDGAPEWAIRDDGEPFEPQSQWFLNYFQPAVQRAFDNFWLYTDGEHADLQDHYMDAWAVVAERFADHPAVLGYDLMNEPHPGSMVDLVELLGTENPSGTHPEFDQTRLQPFLQRTINRIREVDGDNWIFYEPRYGAPGDGLPSYLGTLTDPRPDGNRLVYHPHLYSVGLEGTGRYDDNDDTVADWERNRATEMAQQNCAMVLGEWGLSQSTENGHQFMLDVVDMADRLLSGWTYWDYGFGGWMPVDADGNELPGMDILVRTYAKAIAGTPTSHRYDAESRVFELVFEHREGVSGPTEIYVPSERHYPDGWSITSSDPDGSWTHEWDASTEVLRVSTDAASSPHRIVIAPAP
jgi:endoglycosylceramidase